MRLIDLYNKYVNDEEMPKKIKADKKIYVYDCGLNDYYCTETDKYLMDIMNTLDSLNTEIEVIEDKPEKIGKLEIMDNKLVGEWENGSSYNYTLSAPQTVITKKLNETIDRLNELLEKSDK